jgi:hypothetical protein
MEIRPERMTITGWTVLQVARLRVHARMHHAGIRCGEERTAMTGRLSDMQKGKRELYSIPQTQESSVKLSDLQKSRKKH